MPIRHRRRVWASQFRRGVAAVEMAIVLPVLLLILIGMIESSRMLMVSQVLTNAAREGCRMGVINGRTTADVEARVNQILADARINGATIVTTPGAVQTTSLGDPVTVTITVDFQQVSWLASPFLYQNATLTGSATMSSERP